MTLLLQSALFLFLALTPGLNPSAQTPVRVVSLSLCTDELAILLSGGEGIASVTWLAADAEYSLVADRIDGISLNRATAEEVIALDPDLIMNSRFSAGNTVNLLGRLGHDVHSIELPLTLEENYQAIRKVAALTGNSAEGEAMIGSIQSRIDEALQSIRDAVTASVALFYTGNGYSYGRGTLRDFFIASLGWQNLASLDGLYGVGQFPMEKLIAGEPDFLLVDKTETGDRNLTHPLLSHPALEQTLHSGILELPEKYFQCPGPGIASAYEALARQLQGNTQGPEH